MNSRKSIRFHLTVLVGLFTLAECSYSSSNHFVVGIKPMQSRWSFTLHIGDIDRLAFSGRQDGTATFTSEQKQVQNGGVQMPIGDWSYFDVIENDDQLHIIVGDITLSYEKTLEGSVNLSIEASQIEYRTKCRRKCNISISKDFPPKLNHTYFLKALYPQSEPLICPASSFYVENSKWYNYTFGKGFECLKLQSKSDFFITECDPELSTPLCDADNAADITTGIREYATSSSSPTFEQETTITTLRTGKVTTDEKTSISTSAGTTTTTQEQTELVTSPSAGRHQEVEMESDKSVEKGIDTKEVKINGGLIVLILSLCLLIGAVIAVVIYRAKTRRMNLGLMMTQ